MLLKVCKCGKLIPQEIGMCDRCKAAAGNRHKEYNKYQRNQTAAAFYVSKQWRQMRGNILAAYDYIDLYAYEVLHEIRRADTVHHIKELNEAWERRLDITNLIPLASSTHNTIHTLYDSDPVTKAQTQATLWRLVKEAAARPGYQNCFGRPDLVPLPFIRGENSPRKILHNRAVRGEIMCQNVTH